MKKYLKFISLVLSVIAIVMSCASIIKASADVFDGRINEVNTIVINHNISGISFNPQIVFKASTNPLTKEKYEDKTPWLKTGEYVATSTAVPYYPLYDNYVKVGKLNASCEYLVVFYGEDGNWTGYTVRSSAPASEVLVNSLEMDVGTAEGAVSYKLVTYAPGMTAKMWKKSQMYASKSSFRVSVTAEYEGDPARKDMIIALMESILFGGNN